MDKCEGGTNDTKRVGDVRGALICSHKWRQNIRSTSASIAALCRAGQTMERLERPTPASESRTLQTNGGSAHCTRTDLTRGSSVPKGRRRINRIHAQQPCINQPPLWVFRRACTAKRLCACSTHSKHPTKYDADGPPEEPGSKEEKQQSTT